MVLMWQGERAGRIQHLCLKPREGMFPSRSHPCPLPWASEGQEPVGHGTTGLPQCQAVKGSQSHSREQADPRGTGWALAVDLLQQAAGRRHAAQVLGPDCLDSNLTTVGLRCDLESYPPLPEFWFLCYKSEADLTLQDIFCVLLWLGWCLLQWCRTFSILQVPRA